MLVGEQPGDQEDQQGRPFVGPAGQLLDRAMAEAGIDRASRLRDQRGQALQVHPRAASGGCTRSPTRARSSACRPWLLKELDIVQPRVLVALGATAAHSILGRSVTIARERGSFRPYPPDAQLYITVHPSYLLRLPDERAKAAEYARFVEDLRTVKEMADKLAAGGGADADRPQMSLL